MINFLKLSMAYYELKYRMPKKVTKIFQSIRGDTYPICPKCNISMEFEYQSYCDRCGQALDWRDFDNAQVVTAKRKTR